ncbi:MAG: hypothetical protein HY682_06840 [Chloroflexi bacterium]|nr:hypothetical protein [Chloroflexota bacterium]
MTSLLPADLIDCYIRLISRELPGLTRREVEQQLAFIMKDQRPTTHDGELIARTYRLIAPPIPAG